MERNVSAGYLRPLHLHLHLHHHMPHHLVNQQAAASKCLQVFLLHLHPQLCQHRLLCYAKRVTEVTNFGMVARNLNVMSSGCTMQQS